MVTIFPDLKAQFLNQMTSSREWTYAREQGDWLYVFKMTVRTAVQRELWPEIACIWNSISASCMQLIAIPSDCFYSGRKSRQNMRTLLISSLTVNPQAVNSSVQTNCLSRDGFYRPKSAIPFLESSFNSTWVYRISSQLFHHFRHPLFCGWDESWSTLLGDPCIQPIRIRSFVI